MQKLKSKRGITLIALIITIIVMLILVGVTINIGLEGGIISKAKTAAEKAKEAARKESKIGAEITAGDVTYSSLENYLYALQKSRVKVATTKVYAEDNKSATIKVSAFALGGEFVSYREFAMNKLEGKNQEEKEQMFIDGNNYWSNYYAELFGGEAEIYNNMQAFLESMGIEEKEELYQNMGFNSFEDLMIDWISVCPEEYEHWDSIVYEKFAEKKLIGKTQAEKEQIFIEGNNYLFSENYTNMNEYLEENGLDSNFYETDGYPSFEACMIDYRCVYPEEYDTLISEEPIEITIENPDGETTTTSTDFVAIQNGEYTFTATALIGGKTHTTVEVVEIDSIDSERFSNIYTQTATYTDSQGKTATIPAGFAVGVDEDINTIDGGLVITDCINKYNNSIGNEYVWIPVGNISQMAIYQTDYTYGQYTTGYYRGKAYKWTSESTYSEILDQTLYGPGTANYNEPVTITGNLADKNMKNTYTGTEQDADVQNYSTILGFNSVSEFSTHMLYTYQNMVQSVDNNKGFYVARYETSLSGSTVQSKKYQNALKDANWYNMYYYQDSTRNINNPYYTSNSVVSGMIAGCQFDQVLIWLTDKGINCKSKSIGNYSEVDQITGNNDNWKTLNIYDISGNLAEFTTEAHQNGSRMGRVSRGYNVFDEMIELPIYRNGKLDPTRISSSGTRMTLYIK